MEFKEIKVFIINPSWIIVLNKSLLVEAPTKHMGGKMQICLEQYQEQSK